VSEKDLIHLGSGFGAVEGLRLKKDGAGEIPKSMCFPEFTIGRYEYPWKYLIENGKFPPEDARYYTPSYNVNEHWLPYIEKAVLSDTDNWYAHMQYGIAVYDGVDNTVFASDAYTDEDNERRTAIAEREWKRSIELSPSYLAYRNLARLEIQRNNNAAAIDYYQKAIGIQGAFDDYALAAEYSVFLTMIKEYQMLWDFYNSLPENCRNADRIKMQTAIAAVKLDQIDYLEVFFAEEHYDIREGENSLTDIWFEFCARKMAKERGISKLDDEILDKLIDEAWEKCPPDESIDFRMSFSRSTKYRVNQ
jgi:tetratricopeptide (TPR) repeat protein